MGERTAWRLALLMVLAASLAACVRWWPEPATLLGEGAEAAWRKYTAIVCGVVALAALAITSPPHDRRDAG